MSRWRRHRERHESNRFNNKTIIDCTSNAYEHFSTIIHCHCTNTMGRCQILRHTEKADKRVRKLIFIIVSKLEG